MVAEHTDSKLGVSRSQGYWALINTGEEISTTWASSDRHLFPVGYILSLLTVLVCLCGAAGNGAVVWLLGFCLKRSPFSVYILNLACADGAYLLSTGVRVTLLFLHHDTWEIHTVVSAVRATSHLAGLGLLMAISTEYCVSALCPLWYRCRRPAHLSCTMCMLIWGLGLCAAVYECVCGVVIPCVSDFFFYSVMVVVTFLVLCVSSLTLLVRFQCGSRGTQPSRLHVTILVTILAFLLLALPYTVFFLVVTIMRPQALYGLSLLVIFTLFFTLICAVNPVIYFLMGRYRQRPGRTPLQEVLQRALSDKEEGAEKGDMPSPVLTLGCPLSTGTGPSRGPQV